MGAEVVGEDELVWTFAFGSNLLQRVLVERRKVYPTETVIGRVDGYEFSLRYHGFPFVEPAFAVIVETPHTDVCVWGAAYRITKKELAKIIQTEGSNYVMKTVQVQPEHGDPIMAHALTMPRECLCKYPIFWSRRYRGLCIEGAKEKMLPERYIAFLEAHPAFELTAVDYALIIVFAPITFPAFGFATLLLTLLPHLSAEWHRRFLFVVASITPALWRIHDIIPASWRPGADARVLEIAAAGLEGEWFSEEYRKAKHS